MGGSTRKSIDLQGRKKKTYIPNYFLHTPHLEKLGPVQHVKIYIRPLAIVERSLKDFCIARIDCGETTRQVDGDRYNVTGISYSRTSGGVSMTSISSKRILRKPVCGYR